MDYSTLSEEFLDSDVYRQRMKWSILTTVDSPEFQGTHSPFDAKFGDVLKNRWEDGLIQSALLLCFVIPVVHVILHRAVCTVRPSRELASFACHDGQDAAVCT